MSVQSLDRAASTTTRLHAVLCGSFRRDREALAKAHSALLDSFTLLSPVTVDFVEPEAEFVRLAHEVAETVSTIEERHLAAIVDADFVWLHAPEGYVGRSAAMEIGHARALGVPVFTDAELTDEMLASCVRRIAHPRDVPAALEAAPGRGLAGLQRYYGRISARRGWDTESAQDTLLLITEEMGELARAVRKNAGMRRDGAYPAGESVHDELADVQLYLVHLANTLGVDIAAAVTAKEASNARRFDGAGTSADVA